ncbi:SUKH-4 family immunity protein [Streptomyces sp. NPDC048483]|uniref:SUKH-4 family immunity protein n=1 Tax=Streptomyces sp. NPDC048483 TaxID=3154927 RepID=UPI0034172E2E
MSTGPDEPTDELTNDLLDDPARLLAADRAAVRAHIEGMSAAPHIGREVFQQAEAIFGGAEVSRAEFASWLQFAARVLGHDAYAEGLAAAEPGMPWRTAWAWWRPVGKHVAHPNLSQLMTFGLQTHDGRKLVRVEAAWENTWLDLETGAQVAGPTGAATTALPAPCDAQHGQLLHERKLFAPESWSDASPFPGEYGRTRYLVRDSYGLALLDTDPVVLRDWPRGRIDGKSSRKGTPGQVPSFPAPDGPLTAERLDEAFAPVDVVRIPEHKLPTALDHPASRAHLRDIGLPSFWACAWTTFEVYPARKMVPLAGEEELGYAELPDGLDATDLLPVGEVEHLGDLYLHRRQGSVYAIGDGSDLVQLSPDLDHFTRLLEAVRRYMSACWNSYPGEDATEGFLEEVDRLAPGVVGSGGPSGEIWEDFIAGITTLNEDGF